MTETRAEKAQRLMDEGRLSLIDPSSYSVSAEVRGDHAHYQTILYSNSHYFCDCAWGRIYSHTDKLCAHALAVKLMTEKENKP